MLFLRLAPIFLAAGIQIVAAADSLPDFATPGVFAAGGDPDTTLKSYVGGPVKGADTVTDNEPNLIRGLLMARQSCPSGYGLCTDGG
jgi:hypothetical protein